MKDKNGLEMYIVDNIDTDVIICEYEECPQEAKGLYFNCYMHTYVMCPIFDKEYRNRYC